MGFILVRYVSYIQQYYQGIIPINGTQILFHDTYFIEYNLQKNTANNMNNMVYYYY